MSHKDRAKTIAANGEIVPKPYGYGRWHSPRRYGCAHVGCGGAAATLVRAGTHPVDDRTDTRPVHNCCGQHESPPKPPTA